MMRSGAFAAFILAVVGGGLAASAPGDDENIGGIPMPELSQYHNNAAVQQDEKIRYLGQGEDLVDTAARLVKTVMPGAEFRVVKDHYISSDGIAHVYFKQLIHGLDVANGDFNVNLDSYGRIFSYGHSFYTGPIPEKSPFGKRQVSDPVEAFQAVVKRLNLGVGYGDARPRRMEGVEHYAFEGTKGCVRDPEAKLVYLQRRDTGLSLTWRIETDILRNWLISYVDASDSNTVHGIANYISDFDASFQVYPWGVQNPTQGQRKVLQNPWNLESSPFTWISNDGREVFDTLRGNNAIAQANLTSDTPKGQSPIPLSSPQCTPENNEGMPEYDQMFCLNRPVKPDLMFNYPYSTDEAEKQAYRNASLTQVFYTVNKYHDLLYVLGFDEQAGNFQFNNNRKGGRGNDFVVLYTQDGSGINNANFGTPPDGEPGRMRMYMWDQSKPQRDGAFDAAIVLHEYTHGVSNRLTGGPRNSECLDGIESAGMGEGWSDAMAMAVLVNETFTRETSFPLSPWAINRPGGIRSVPYSTNLKIDPLTYDSVNGLVEEHIIGEIWATVLYDVMWNLIDAHGIKNQDFPELGGKGKPKDGRYLTMKLVMSGMALQPCNPNMVSGRDAILDADKALTGGENQDILWKAFAKRGLGVGAKYDPKHRTADFSVPK